MGDPLDWSVEIHRRAPRFVPFTATAPGIDPANIPVPPLVPGDPLTIPAGRIIMEGLNSINRAVERDLLNFRTGDATLTFDNQDGFFTDLFANFGPEDRWQLRLFRRGEMQFWGVVLGQGSIQFDAKEETVEITAYGLTRQLNDATAEAVSRARTIPAFLVDSASAGATGIRTNSTDKIGTGDVLLLSDQLKSETVTVKQTVAAVPNVLLEAPLVNAFTANSPPDANGTAVTQTTPYWRHRGLRFLIEQAFAASGIPIAEIRLSQSLFRRLAPTPVNIGGISSLPTFQISPVEIGDRAYFLGGAHAYQTVDRPDENWTIEATPATQVYVDWSRYFREDEPAPPTVLQWLGATGNQGSPFQKGFDYRNVPYTCYFYSRPTTPDSLRSRTSSDGITWSGGDGTLISNYPDAYTPSENSGYGVEYDPVRHGCYVFANNGAATISAYFYDLTAGTWTNLRQAGEAAGFSYLGPVYVPDKDYCLLLRANNMLGPSFEIAAFRGATRLWVKPFPKCLVQEPEATGSLLTRYPTQMLRQVDGSFYTIVVVDGRYKLLRTDDEFDTYVLGDLNAPIADTKARNMSFAGGRIAGTYRYFTYRGTAPVNYGIAAPFYAGVILYADFEGKSNAEALKDLAILSNAVFWVDDDGQGHFVARDLFDPGAVIDITDRVMERSETLIWDETASYVEVEGGGVTAISGNKDLSSSGISINSPFIPNEAFAQALADSYAAFFSTRRAHVEVEVLDPDGHIYRPLDRVMLGGRRWLVYESDHDLADDQVRLQLLEDV